MRKYFVFVAFIAVALFAYYQEQKSVASMAAQQSAATKNWMVVESRYENGQEKEIARRWLVSPEDQWLIIPEAYKTWANQITEGQEVTDMPAFVQDWNKAVFPEKRETAELRAIGLVKTDSHTWLAAKFFFVK
jgi:hypothetical protein